ncbi:MAG: SCO family protein [Hyphomicrobium sp.]
MFPDARNAIFASPGATTTSGKALIGGRSLSRTRAARASPIRTFAAATCLVFFGFTNCPDICPAGLQLISAALDKLGPQSKNITPIFISVDPERDTPEKLAAYVKNFDDRIVGLTGTPEDIAAVARAYRVFYEKTPSEEDAVRLRHQSHVDHLPHGT